MPETAENVDWSRSAAAALPTTATGVPAPAGKCRAETVSPTTESGVPRNEPLLVSPLACRSSSPNDATARITAVATQTRRGCRLIAVPVRAQKPVGVGSCVPTFGFAGQNTHRPQVTSSAGSSEIIEHRAITTPIAATGPRPLVDSV